LEAFAGALIAPHRPGASAMMRARYAQVRADLPGNKSAGLAEVLQQYPGQVDRYAGFAGHSCTQPFRKMRVQPASASRAPRDVAAQLPPVSAAPASVPQEAWFALTLSCGRRVWRCAADAGVAAASAKRSTGMRSSQPPQASAAHACRRFAADPTGRQDQWR
jgi:hypothetical protein